MSHNSAILSTLYLFFYCVLNIKVNNSFRPWKKIIGTWMKGTHSHTGNEKCTMMYLLIFNRENICMDCSFIPVYHRFTSLPLLFHQRCHSGISWPLLLPHSLSPHSNWLERTFLSGPHNRQST